MLVIRLGSHGKAGSKQGGGWLPTPPLGTWTVPWLEKELLDPMIASCWIEIQQFAIIGSSSSFFNHGTVQVPGGGEGGHLSPCHDPALPMLFVAKGREGYMVSCAMPARLCFFIFLAAAIAA